MDGDSRVLALVCAGSPLIVTFISILTKSELKKSALVLFIFVFLNWVLSLFLEVWSPQKQYRHLFFITKDWAFDFIAIALSFYLIEEILHDPDIDTESVDRAGSALVTPYILYLTIKLSRQCESYQLQSSSFVAE